MEAKDYICRDGCRHIEDPARGILSLVIKNSSTRPLVDVRLVMKNAAPEETGTCIPFQIGRN